MAVPVPQTAFTSGEISPYLWGDVDLVKYHAGLSTCRNCFVSYKGGIASRAGTAYVGRSMQTGTPNPPRLVPFQFSVEQGYALEFGNQYMRVVANGAYVTEAPITIIGATQANPCQITVAELAPPAAPTLSAVAAGSLAATTYYVKITYLTANGETAGSAEASLAVAANNVLRVASPSSNGRATGWNVYVSTATGTETLQASNIAIGSNWQEPISGLVTGGASVPTANTSSQMNNGDWIFISGVGGMTQLNSHTFIAQNATANTFTLTDLDGNAINSTTYGAYTSGGTAARIYTLSTPYFATDLEALKWVQSADVMSIAHQSYQPRDLSRFAAADWSIADMAPGNTLPSPSGLTATATSTTTTAPASYSYVVTAVDGSGNETRPSNVATVTNSVNMSATAGSIDLVWGAVSGAQSYNIYRAPIAFGGAVPGGQVYGYVGSAQATTFTDTNTVPSFSVAPPQQANPFAPSAVSNVYPAVGGSGYTNGTGNLGITSSTGTGFAGYAVIENGAVVSCVVQNGGQGYNAANDTVTLSGAGSGSGFVGSFATTPSTGTYPGVVAYFQSRRAYASTANNPDTLFFSRPGDFTNFDISIPVADDDAITATPWAQQVNGINCMIPMPFGLIVGTGLGAWQVEGPNSFGANQQPITPANIAAVPQSQHGFSATIPPIKVNYDVIYVQGKGAVVRDLSYNFFVSIYTGNDLTLLSSHLFEGHTIREWAWCEQPNRIIWAVRDDGILLSLTYLKEQQVWGWARHDTNGTVVSLCSVSEPPVDALYMVIERTVNGSQRYYVERMDNRIWASAEDPWCVDCGVALVMPLSSATLTPSAATGSGVTFTASAGIFSAGDVGAVIRAGGGIATITAYTSATQVTGTWNLPMLATYPNDPNATPIPQQAGSWTKTQPVTTVGGLLHLAGANVVGLADGVPVGPLAVSSTGSVTLPFAATNVKLGLPFTAQVQTLFLDAGQPTIQGRRKSLYATTVRVHASAGISVGTNQPDGAAACPPSIAPAWSGLAAMADQGATYTSPSGQTVRNLWTGDLRAVVSANWAKPAQVAIQQSGPRPLEVLLIAPEFLPGDSPENALQAPAQRSRGAQPAMPGA